MASWMILSRVYTSFLWMNVKVKTNSWKKFGSEYFHSSRHHCFPQQIIVAGFTDKMSLHPDEGVICLRPNVITLYIFLQYFLMGMVCVIN